MLNKNIESLPSKVDVRFLYRVGKKTTEFFSGISVCYVNIIYNSHYAQELRKKWGVLFWFGALFSSLSVAQNIEVLLE